MARRRSRPCSRSEIGDAGARLHAGRSRNDQVLTALRLYLRDAIEALGRRCAQRVAEALDGLAASAGRDRPARLHAHAAGDAELGRALGARICGRDPRRRRSGCATRSGASRRIRSARPPATARRTCRSIATARATRLEFAENHEPVTAVQLSRGKAEAEVLFEVDAADAGPRPARLRPAALLYARVRLRRAARCVHDRLVDHAAEAQSRRVRAGARPHRDGAGVPGRKCSASRPSCRRATSATCS